MLIMWGIIPPTFHVHIPVQVSLMPSNLLLLLNFKTVMELPKFWFFKCFLVEQCYTSPWTDSIKLFNGGPWKSTTWGWSSFTVEAPMHSSFSSLALWQSLIMVGLQSSPTSFRFCFFTIWFLSSQPMISLHFLESPFCPYWSCLDVYYFWLLLYCWMQRTPVNSWMIFLSLLVSSLLLYFSYSWTMHSIFSFFSGSCHWWWWSCSLFLYSYLQ